MEPQAPFVHRRPMAAHPASLHALVRNVLRQPTATSDTLLILADALNELATSEDAKRLATLLQDLAPLYAAVPLEWPGAAPLRPVPIARPPAEDPARALIRRHPVRAARLRQLLNDCPRRLEPKELSLLTALCRAADLAEGHSP